MKNKKSAVISGILAGILLIACIIPAVSAYTDDDPLITLSYLEQVVVPALKEELIDFIGESLIDGKSSQNEEVQSEKEPQKDNKEESVNETQSEGEIQSETTSASIGTYTLLELTKGQEITAESICEFIVRPGSKVIAVSPFEAQGIADITNGIEVLDGDEISINAYCLIPRGGDGRGMKIESESAYIMIRGEYTIG